MAITAQLHDGRTLEFPDGTDPAIIQRTVKATLAAGAQPAAAPAAAERGFVESIGDKAMEVGRQVGLTARHGLRGLAQTAEIGTEPIRHFIVNPLARLVGAPEAAPLSASANQLSDVIGLPVPRNATERVVGDATSLMAGGAGMAGAAGRASNAVTGVGQNVLAQMAANRGTQVASAATAGALGGSVREAGGGPVAQFLASLAGGVGGGMAANKLTEAARAGGNSLMQLLRPATATTRAADQQINLILERSGIDWSQVPERIRQGMREEVAQVMQTGQGLNADALRRLLAFRSTGTTPTVGMLTQNPGQITREMNLAKTGANSTDVGLQRLPELQNRNVTTLLRRLDEAGAANAPDAATASRTAIGALEGRVAQERGEIGRLYSAARDTQGRSLDLERSAFTQRANQMLDEAMVGGSLPPDVANTMNRIARGEMPFTVELSEQLKTRIGNLQRASSDGGTRMALGLVRQALDETPLRASPPVNPGNLPAVPGTVPPSAQAIGQESIDAFNQARAANRAYMQTLEANPALAAVDDAISAVRSNPQLGNVGDVVGTSNFVQRFITSKGASPREVSGLLQQVGPAGQQAIRQNIVSQLRAAATNNTDDIAKFSNQSYRDALRSIGDEKLALLFSREELQMLRDIGSAAKYMQAQPTGSAVNNSNSGALILGRGLDMLERAAGYVPLGGRDILKGVLQGAQQTQVLAPRNALALPAAQQPSSNAMLPLLAATVPTSAKPRQDDRRR